MEEKMNKSNQYSTHCYWDGSCLLKSINDINFNSWFKTIIEMQEFVNKFLEENG
jgi:hypothetical protein